MINFNLKVLFVTIFVGCATIFGGVSTNVYAQKATLDSSVGIASRYIFRGVMLDDAPQIQISLGVKYHHFSLYGWGSHAIGQHDGNYREVRFWLNYTKDIGNLRVMPQIENFYNANARFFDLHFLTTGHVFQGSVKLDSPLKTTPELIVGYSFGTPIEETYYIEGAFRVTKNNLDVRSFISTQYSDGPGFMDMGYNSKFVINQIGITAIRKIELNETLTMPLSISFILNPHTEKIYASVVISI